MLKILVVEDDETLREAFTGVIEDLGDTSVEPVGSYAEVDSLGDRVLEFNLIFLDVNLGPGVPSGIDIYLLLRKKGFSGKIIFFTGHAGAHPRLKEFLTHPGVELLTKPVSSLVIKALLIRISKSLP